MPAGTYNLNKAYTWCIQTCNAPNVGYSQSYRNQSTINGITYYDCSSLIWFALKAGGWPLGDGWPFTTYTMGAILGSMGWARVPITGEWKPGDICLNPDSHVEMVYSGGMGSGVTMGAHTDNAPLPDQVSINSYASTSASWQELWRYGSGGADMQPSNPAVVAALCGNSWRESFINPGAVEGGTGIGFGLFQWSFERRTNLENYLRQNGYPLDSGNGQCAFLIEEGDWIQNYGPYASLQEFLDSTSSDIAELTRCFMECWERPGVPALEERIEHAYTCAAYCAAHAQDTNITDWIASSGTLSEDQILNNAVMMYRYFSVGGGGGGVPGTEKKGMPVWMKIRYHEFYL